MIAASAALGRARQLRVVEFIPDPIILLSKIALVRLHYVIHHLWVLLLLCLWNAIVCEHSLPVLGQACELTSLIVVANMDHMNRILRCGYLDCSWGPHYTVHEAGKPTLLTMRSRWFAGQNIARESLWTDRSVTIVGPRWCNFGQAIFSTAKRLRVAELVVAHIRTRVGMVKRRRLHSRIIHIGRVERVQEPVCIERRSYQIIFRCG